MQSNNIITSSANPLLKKIRGLHERAWREKSSLYLIEGVKLVQEALQKNASIENIVASQSYFEEHGEELNRHIEAFPQLAKSPALTVVADKEFKNLSTIQNSEGLLALAKIPPPIKAEDIKLASKNPLVLICDCLQDPGNLGTIMRSAFAASADLLVLTKGSVDPYSPKVVRAAMGSLFSLPISYNWTYQDIDNLIQYHKLELIACDQNAKRVIWDGDLTKGIALAIGNEGNGLSEPLVKRASALYTIPMNANCESLNAAISASICLFAAVEQRRKTITKELD